MTYCLQTRVLPELAEWYPEFVSIRREIHQSPELGFDTHQTCERISALLARWGVKDIHADLVQGGIIASVSGTQPGPTIAIRADIDALPMQDCSNNSWKSRFDGRCHSCGHDGHQTWLLAVMRTLAAKPDFPGRILAIFQPAEELGRGAKAVIESGVLSRYGVQEIYAGHCEPFLPKGYFGFRAGPLQASADMFYVTLKGVGTHGGRPHQGVDPIPVGAQIVSAAQTIVSRRVNPIESAVLSICSFTAGSWSAANVIPQGLTMSGCVRTFTPQMRAMIQEKFTKLVQGIALANDCSAEVDYQLLVSSVCNDPSLAAFARKTATELFGADRAVEIDPMMSSEDFAEYQKLIPGFIVRVGVRDDNHAVSVHNGAFDVKPPHSHE